YTGYSTRWCYLKSSRLLKKSTISSRGITYLSRATEKNSHFNANDLQYDIMEGGKNISVQSIRKLDKNGRHVRTSCGMPLKKNIKSQLIIMFYGINVWCKKGKTYEQKDTLSIIKHGGGPVLLWGCFAVAGNVSLDCMKDIMDSLKYQAVLAKIVMFLVQRLKLDDQWCYVLELC
uniref:Uncharacterized protein n=1 Tax=Sinocyclocheilus anshuiensis TaxID=1608454 RepID=A0A671LIA4_9TELE